MWRYPFGSGGKRVTTRPSKRRLVRSSAMIFWMKFCGAASGVIARDDTGKRSVGQPQHRRTTICCPVSCANGAVSGGDRLHRSSCNGPLPTRRLLGEMVVSFDLNGAERRLARSLRIARLAAEGSVLERRRERHAKRDRASMVIERGNLAGAD